jgi:hypothetical protein
VPGLDAGVHREGYSSVALECVAEVMELPTPSLTSSRAESASGGLGWR